ncbi:hypothetical protein OW666_18645 [Acinetobacter baumannii]|uniref:hypothetical protein n=1 Tax=Acinetobacter baumannii TaxID=470 RepID=UPI002340422D|nr:hypothetical protein [Acinetobacter baumannii]MDC4584781.1 hypothetical protein [Acinetobacter baumannii]MDK2130864.1 hypothetical protein [Acinetobacter baumannii]MDK2161558.1 hypothetical protein [Acinetobacter baumannii]MDK2169035.1 hypothetical protein [Acinetobacter baumannii]MDK2252595.1 hypothetical protein [Acinetobacter baumannii]
MEKFSIASLLDDLLNHPELPLEEFLTRYFSKDYKQCTNGQWDNLDTFAQHALKLREVVKVAKIEVLDELHDAKLYADRHRVYITKYDGTKVVQEVYLFAELNSLGKLIRTQETTLMLEGNEGDREIGTLK